MLPDPLKPERTHKTASAFGIQYRTIPAQLSIFFGGRPNQPEAGRIQISVNKK